MNSPTVVDAAPGDAAPPEGATPHPSASAASLPEGWRWESYRDVELAVPNEWGWINGSQRTGQWCTGDGTTTGVGRPGGSSLVGCLNDPAAVSPGALIASNGMFVAFAQARFEPAGTVGDRRTVHLGKVAVLVQAEPDLRERILATLHTIKVDANGCSVRDKVTSHPSRAPSPAVALKDLTGVTSAAACFYDLHQSSNPLNQGASLVSSVRLTGPTAARTLAAIAKAPPAGGQDTPETCTDKYGSQMLVLLVRSAAGPSRVHVRFSGCDHNAVDDGVSPRRLTPAVRPFFMGPNTPDSMSGDLEKAAAIVGVHPDGSLPPRTAPPH